MVEGGEFIPTCARGPPVGRRGWDKLAPVIACALFRAGFRTGF